MDCCWNINKKKERNWCSYWYPCQCDCGTIKNIQKKNLINGTSKSCGCYRSVSAKDSHMKHGYLKKGQENIVMISLCK